MRGDIIGELAVKILKPDRELGDCLVGFLAHGKELSRGVLASEFLDEKVLGTSFERPGMW